MEQTRLFIYTAIIGFLAFVAFRLLRLGRRPEGYPPGPPTVPILGNIHQVGRLTPGSFID